MEKLRKLYPDREFFLSKYEHVFEELEKLTDLPTLTGEFLDGKYMRVHRSIYSTRMDIKAANARIENKLTNILEPLASLAYTLGIEYHHGLIELIWKEIMKNHAHDSIGCCADKVHREIANRFFLAEEKTDQLIQFYKRKITDSVNTSLKADRLAAFNLLPYEREDVVTTTVITKLKSFELQDELGQALDFEVLHSEEMDPGLIDRQIVHYGNYDPFFNYTVQFKDRLPAMGYKTYFVKESAAAPVSNTLETRTSVETDFYRIAVNANGTLNIFDKRLNRSFDQVLLLENGGDDGDEYDYSPLEGETLLYSSNVQAQVDIKQNKFAASVSIRYNMPVPADLQKRKDGIVDGEVGVLIKLSIPNDKATISIDLELDNKANDHRLRMLIPTGLSSSFSVSDNQFGSIQRPVVDAAMDVWEKENWTSVRILSTQCSALSA